jgi:hypothetical protein
MKPSTDCLPGTMTTTSTIYFLTESTIQVLGAHRPGQLLSA